jgi:hypothetical protein
MYSSYSFMTSALERGGVVSVTLWPCFTLWEMTPVPIGLGGLQSQSGHRGCKKNPLLLPGIEPRSPGRPVRGQTLYCLSYPGSTSINSLLKFAPIFLRWDFFPIYGRKFSTYIISKNTERNNIIINIKQLSFKHIVSVALFVFASITELNNFRFYMKYYVDFPSVCSR